ncbi:hypothetical protein Dimus_014595 [Dionaea muscipula]
MVTGVAGRAVVATGGRPSVTDGRRKDGRQAKATEPGSRRQRRYPVRTSPRSPRWLGLFYLADDRRRVAGDKQRHREESTTASNGHSNTEEERST